MKKILALVLALGLATSLTVGVNAAAVTDESTDTTATSQRNHGNHQRGEKADLSVLLSDYPHELLAIEAIHTSVEAGEITRDEAKELMAPYSELLQSLRPERMDAEKESRGEKPNLGVLLADYPDELLAIEAIHASVEAGEITRDEAKELMAPYSDLLQSLRPGKMEHPNKSDGSIGIKVQRP